MFEKRELLWIMVGIILMTLMLMFQNNTLVIEKWWIYLIISFVVLFVSIIAKKITASKIDTKIEVSIWQFSRWWITKKSYLTKPIPIGILLPLLLSFLSTGIVKFFAFFQFKAEALPSKVSKKYGARRFSNVMDWDYALICFYSLVAVLFLAIITTIVAHTTSFSFPFQEMARIALYFSIANLIPFGQLDGIRIFMGSRPLYIFSLVILVITGLIVFI